MDNMNITRPENDEEIVIDLGELLNYYKSHLIGIIIPTLALALVFGVVTVFLISKKYTSTARVYLKPEVTEGSISYSDVNAQAQLVTDYVEMFAGNNIQEQVAYNLNIDIEEVSEAISVSNKSGTKIINVSATTTNPELSKQIVDESVSVFKKMARSNLDITNITIIDNAVVPDTPSSPSLKKNLAIGGLIGLFISMAYYTIRYLLDTRIHNLDDAENYLHISMLGAVPYAKEEMLR